MKRFFAAPVRITLIYAGLGTLWILASDWIAGDLILSGSPVLTMQTLKGLVYVAATAALIYFLIRNAVARIHREAIIHRRDEEFRRAVADCLPLGVITLDAEGKIQSWNDAATRIFGWTAKECLGKDLPFIPAGKKSESTALIDRALGGEILTGIELVRLHKDGSPFDMRLSAAPLIGERGSVFGILAIVEDISERKRAEVQSRVSEERFRLLSKATRDAIWDWDVTKNKLWWNKNFEALYGYDIKDVENVLEWWSECIHPDDREKMQEEFQGIVAGDKDTWISRYRFRHKNGTYVPVLDRGHVIHGADGKPVRMIGGMTDLTEQERTEKELRQSEERLASLISNLPGTAFRCRLDADWTTLFVSEGITALTGYPSSAFSASGEVTYGQLVHPADRGRIFRDIQAAAEAMQPYEIEYRVVARDGTEKTVWERGRFFPGENGDPGDPGHLEGFILDVTARREAESERERLMVAIEQLGEMVVITDPRGVIEYVNSAFEHVTGYAREEAAGKTPSILKSGKHDAAFYAGIWETVTKGDTWNGTIVNRRKDGTLYPEENTISPVRDEAGRILHYVAVKTDATEKKEQEAALRQMQKMEAVGQLAGGVAHDFNNMLTVILVRAEMALRRTDPADPVHAGLKEIHDAAGRSANLTRQLLTYARRQTVQPQALDLNDQLREVLPMLRGLVGESIELRCEPARDSWRVKVDPTQVDQLLVNLCLNARDAIPIGKSGTITIGIRNARFKKAPSPQHTDFAPGEYVVLTVQDSGSGMDERILGRVFEPFFTTKEVGKGTGLGLPTVHGIVKQNEGYIDVESAPGKGSRFRIYLPRHHKPEASAPGPKSAATGKRKATVLLVEDEAVILEIASEVLRELGHPVLLARSPVEALLIARNHPEEIGLLMTDMVMPEMNGRELADRFLEIRPQARCLFMSGYHEPAARDAGNPRDNGIFVQKPFTTAELAAKVDTALRS